MNEGLDPEYFDLKTLFKLHDKDGDGVLDEYELETMFLADLDKVRLFYKNKSDNKYNFPSEMYRNMKKIDTSSPQITLPPCSAGTSNTDFLQPWPSYIKGSQNDPKS